jgi:hypothetical protein
MNWVIVLMNWVIVWINCLRQPFLTIERELSGHPNDTQCLIYTLQLWTISFSIDLVLNYLPLYLSFGIHWQNTGFLLPIILVKWLIFLIAGIAIHFGLKLNRVQSNFAQTWYMYAVFIACHSPFLSFIYYFSRLEIFSLLQTAKAQGNSLTDTILEIVTRLDEVPVENTFFSIVTLASDAIIKPLNFFYLGIITILLQRALSAHYESPKYETFFGITLGLVVFNPFTLIPASLYLFLTYTVL